MSCSNLSGYFLQKLRFQIHIGARRHLQRMALETETTTSNATLISTRTNSAVSSLPIIKFEDLPVSYLLRCHGVRENVTAFLEEVSRSLLLDLQVPRELPALTRINTFDALARNAIVLGIPVHSLESDDGNSLFNFQSPPRPGEESLALPIDLCPTALQRRVQHHPWLDLLPIPKMRDNILCGIQAGELDEDQLCNEIICEILDLDAPSKASLIIWGDPWSISGWELSPRFFAKWSHLLGGCDEVLDATNYWRQKRGAMKIECDLGTRYQS